MYNVITEVASHYGIFKIYNYTQNKQGNQASFMIYTNTEKSMLFEIVENNEISVTLNNSYLSVNREDDFINSKVMITDSVLYSCIPFLLELREELIVEN